MAAEERSKAFYERAVKRLPGGVNSPVRAYQAVGRTPRFIQSAKGAHITDVDGNEMIDYVCSWGPGILGHANPKVVEKVKAACDEGLTFGAPTEREVEMAELLAELVPSMEVLLWFYDRNMGNAKKAVSLIMTGIAILIPVLCVSRFQLIFAVILAVLTFMIVSGHRKIRYLFMAAAGLVPLYVILTIARSHDVTYLNGIFEMKNAATPIFITQPYMYIANNYDNFDCLVRELPAHSMGLKGMFPLWALSGLKFIKPALVDWPIYVNKEELTTVTLFYDAYYDFGIAGVFLFSSVLGVAAAWLSAR